MTPIMSVDDVSFNYAGRSILDHLSFTLRERTSAALIGPNGVGKTTLLRILAGTLLPTSGSVRLDGVPIASYAAKARAQRIAMVPQQLDIPFAFTVEQVVEQGRTPYLGRLRGFTMTDRKAVDRALSLADVSGLRNRIFNELSGGERQRVKVALGLAQEPRLLLLDEPTQNLDIGRQVELIDLLHQLNAEGITVFASIHDLHLVTHNFSHVLLMAPDCKVTQGAPADVMTPRHLSEAFDCDPARHPLLMGAAR
jgi:iron complex transport system ATP-binding protein